MFLKFFPFYFLFFSPALSLARYQVCSITINSSDEIETFKEFLPAKDFEFVELLPSQVNPQQNHQSHWFDRACEKDYRCDILVISGHFGGTFFGESSYSLPTELMEEKACKQNCSGILNGLKEIFLFGCNTLASKTRDHRTNREYLQVLLDDGMARGVAERVVAARYSPLETAFYKRMNFIFSGSETIYGFNELSPLGAHIRAPLRRYFNSINARFGSYTEYLNSGAYKRSRNEELFQQSIHSLNQARIEPENSELDFFRNKCLLYDESVSFSSRIQALEDIFVSKKSGSAFFAVDDFLSANELNIKEGLGRRAFRSIRENSSFAEEFLSYEKHLDYLPYIRMIYYSLLDRFQWANPFDLTILRRQTLLDMIKNPDQESYTSILLLLRQNQISPGELYVSKRDLPESYTDSIWSLLIFEKLRVMAPEWQEEILQHCQGQWKDNKGMCYQALNTLAHIWPKKELALSIERLLSEEDDEGFLYYALRALGQTGSEDYRIHRRIADFLYFDDPELRQEAVQVLGFLKTPYRDIQADLAYLLTRADELLSEEILWSLNQIDVTSEEAQSLLLGYLSKPDKKPEFFVSVFRVFENSSSFSETTIYFFYQILENRENTRLLFPVLETIAKNDNIKHIGIHYRFLLFQQEESLAIKIKALESLSHLTWLHPEIQIPFLNYFQDENEEVRQRAFQILRNVNNLSTPMLSKMRTLATTHKELESLL